MVITKESLIKALRLAVNVEYEDSEVTDPAYMKMSDEDLLLFLSLGVSKEYPTCDGFDDLPDGAAYPLVLLAKKELYLKLAVTNAPDVDLGADNNNYIKQDQRFQHYMKLADNAQDEFDKYKAEDNDITTDPETGISGVRAYDAYLYKGHYSLRNYRLQPQIRVRVKLAGVTTDSAFITWKSVNNDVFAGYEVYFGTSPIYDAYGTSPNVRDHISKDAKRLLSTSDWQRRAYSVSGLSPDSTYYVCVFSWDRNGRFGYSEVEFLTPEEVVIDDSEGEEDAAEDS